jgi:hypothetical protein
VPAAADQFEIPALVKFIFLNRCVLSGKNLWIAKFRPKAPHDGGKPGAGSREPMSVPRIIQLSIFHRGSFHESSSHARRTSPQ